MKENLIEKVIEQIQLDIGNKDHTAIYELLDNIGITELLAYLPEN